MRISDWSSDVCSSDLAALATIDPLRIPAARDLEAIGRARELHALRRHRRNILQRHRSPAKQIGRAGKDQQRRVAAGAREAEFGIQRPYRMFGPDFGGVRRKRLVAVLLRSEGHTYELQSLIR